MFKKLICLILIIKLTAARLGSVPQFNGKNSAIIVDANRLWFANNNNNNQAVHYSNNIRLPAPFPLWHQYLRYRVLSPPPPPPPQQVLPINPWASTKPTKTATTTSTTTTTNPITSTTTTIASSTSAITTPLPFLTDDEFPKELLDIAQNKLGLKSVDEIPSISELGQLLGTKTSKETLNFIQKLTLNDQGVALLKAYIESADYTDNSENENDDDDDYLDEIGDIDEAVKSNNDEDLVVINDKDLNDYSFYDETTTLKPRTSKIMQKLKELPRTHHTTFMERIANFMHLNNLFHKRTKEEEKQNKENNIITSAEISKDISKENPTFNENFETQTDVEIIEFKKDNDGNNILKAPLTVTESMPFNYPIPIRVESSTKPTNNNTSVVHLNTPKILIPHVQKLAYVTKLSTKEIEDFLARKPKILELATKVSRFPLGYDRNSPMEAQVMSVIQKAIEQDEDLRKLLNSTATLK